MEKTSIGQIITKGDLPHSDTAHRFEGYEYGEIGVSFFISDRPPGNGPVLHVHPYAEVFVVQEGQAIFRVGEETRTVNGGQIVIVPPGVPHGYVNSGMGRLRQIDIHTSGRMATEWLEE